MDRAINAFWFFSVLVFLGVVLFTYGFLRNDIALSLQEGNFPAIHLSKSQFFYAAIGVFLVSNVIFYSLARLLKLRLEKLDDESVEYQSKYNLRNWLMSFSLILNVFYGLSVIIISVINNPSETSLEKYAFLAYLGPFLILVGIVALIYILYKNARLKSGQ